MRPFDHVVGDDGELVDFHHSLNLREEAFKESEVAAGDASDRGDGLCVGEVIRVEFFAEFSPLSVEDEGEFFVAEGPILVGEPESTVELREVTELS